MGCTTSRYIAGIKKHVPINEVAVFVPSTRVPADIDLRKSFRGSLSEDLLDRLVSLRSKVVSLAEKWTLNWPMSARSVPNQDDAFTISSLQNALEQYLPVLVGLTKKDYHLEDLVEFNWVNVEERGTGLSIENAWYELLSVVHMMAMLSLSEANCLLTVKDHSYASEKKALEDCMQTAIELLLKAAGHLDYIHHMLDYLPADVRRKLPQDLQETVLEAISYQALGQATEIQLSLAVENEKATLSVKRRLACEQLIYFAQAYLCLLSCSNYEKHAKKHLSFIKWKYLEAKAAAYYYHGLMLDKGDGDIDHMNAFSCLLAADEILAECKRLCLSFCLAKPVTRVPPAWGAMKQLQLKIPEIVFKKSQKYGCLIDLVQESQELPQLPEFQLSLRPDQYELPIVDHIWDSQRSHLRAQTLKAHLKDEMEIDLPTEDIQLTQPL